MSVPTWWAHSILSYLPKPIALAMGAWGGCTPVAHQQPLGKEWKEMLKTFKKGTGNFVLEHFSKVDWGLPCHIVLLVSLADNEIKTGMYL